MAKPLVNGDKVVLSSDDIDGMVEQFKSGDFTLAERFVLAMMNYAAAIGYSICKHEGVSVAYETLCQVPHEVHSGVMYDNELIGYAVQRVKTRCKNFKNANHVFRIPTMSGWRTGLRCKRLPFLIVEEGPLENPKYYENTTSFRMRILERITAEDEFAAIDTFEEMSTCAKTRFETLVIARKIEGYTDQETAELLCTKRHKVTAALRTIRDRWIERMKDECVSTVSGL